MRFFRATPEATIFQRTGVAKTDRKSMPQKDPTRQDTTNKKTPFWTSKLLIFGAKRAFQKQPGRQERAHARFGSPKITSRALLESPLGRKKTLETSKRAQEEISSEISSPEPPGRPKMAQNPTGRSQSATKTASCAPRGAPRGLQRPFRLEFWTSFISFLWVLGFLVWLSPLSLPTSAALVFEKIAEKNAPTSQTKTGRGGNSSVASWGLLGGG